MSQAVQIAGALLILAGFAGTQYGRMATDDKLYLVLNLVGSAILAVLAGIDRQWGFLMLETVWALVSAQSLAAVMLKRA